MSNIVSRGREGVGVGALDSPVSTLRRSIRRSLSSICLVGTSLAVSVTVMLGCVADQQPPGTAESSQELTIADAEGAGRPTTNGPTNGDKNQTSVGTDDLLFGPERCMPQSPYTSFTFLYNDSELQGALLRVEPTRSDTGFSARIRLNGRTVVSAKDFRQSQEVIERSVKLDERNVLVVLLGRPSEGVVVSVVRSPVQLGRVSLSQDWLPVGADQVLDVSVTASVSASESMPIVTLQRTDSRGVPQATEGELVLRSVEPSAFGRRSCRFEISRSFRFEDKGLLYFQVRASASSRDVASELLDIEVLTPLLASDWEAQKNFERAMLDDFARLSADIGTRQATERVFEAVKGNSLVRSAALEDGDTTIAIDYKSGAAGMLRLDYVR